MSWVVSLVEDDDDIRTHLAEVLRARGLNVLEAAHGADALSMLRARGIRPALMVVDLMMPVMDGWALLNAQASEPLIDGVPVVVITAQEAGPLPATVEKIFQKPFALGALIETIRHLCGDLEPARRPLARGSEGIGKLVRGGTPDQDPEAG